MSDKRKAESDLTCPGCRRKFSRSYSVVRHRPGCHGPPPEPACPAPPPRPQCPDCHLTFASKQRLASHRPGCRKTPLPAQLTCPTCPLTWPPRQHVAWQRHRQEAHDPHSFDCPLCHATVRFQDEDADEVCAECEALATRLHQEGRCVPVLRGAWGDNIYAAAPRPWSAQESSTEQRPPPPTPSHVFPGLFPHQPGQPRTRLPAPLPRPQVQRVQTEDPHRRFLLPLAPAAAMGTHWVAKWLAGTVFDPAGEPPHRRLGERVGMASDHPESAAGLGWAPTAVSLISAFLPPDERRPAELILHDLALEPQRQVLRQFQANAVAFCAHSGFWRALKQHARRCPEREQVAHLLDPTASPLVSTTADAFYWLFFSPQAHLLEAQRGVTRCPPPGLTVAQRAALPQTPAPRATLTYDQMSVDTRKLFASLTTYDRWHHTPLWQALSPYLSLRTPGVVTTYPSAEAKRQVERKTQAAEEQLQTELCAILSQHKPRGWVSRKALRHAAADQARRGPPLSWPQRSLREHYPPASILHPLLSLSGPVRVLSRRRPLDDPRSTGEEMLYLLRTHLPHEPQLEAPPVVSMRDYLQALATVKARRG